jgi:signal transduction histidine kinase
LFTPDRKALSVNLALGKGVWLSTPQPYLDLSRFPDLIDAIQTQLLINKQGDSKMMTPGIRTLLDAANNRAILGLPLVQRGQTEGMVLFADARRTRVFSQRDIDMGRALVGQAATALENAGLVHDLEQSLHDLRDTQDRLVQTARLSAMGELAAAVAHQINNPLTTIMVDSEMMLLDEEPESPNYRSLQAISRAGKRAAGVARRLLAIARPNDPEAPPERIDVVDTIEGILSLVKAHIERDRIQIIAKLPEEKLPPVWAVPGQLDDIWLNLLLNAHDALIGREGAQMGITTSYTLGDDTIQVIAWDNGPGIPAKIIDEVFKPFFTTKPVGEGTGLGLHICRQTAERVGGSISVESAPEQGTRFLVRLPINGGG